MNASHLFCETNEKNPALLTASVLKSKSRLALIYNRLGRYEEALTKGLKEAEYIIERGSFEGSKGFSKTDIDAHTGEALLRMDQVEAAEKKFTMALNFSEKALGALALTTWQTKVFRAEARLRLGKLDQAYEDCQAVLNLVKRGVNPYADLLYSQCFYIAAIVKYKQNDLEKAAEHFSDFFKKIKVFCRSFLDNKVYQDLESKMVFDSVIRATLQDLKLCCQHSTSIFSAIYGDSHPFVKSFTLKNEIA